MFGISRKSKEKSNVQGKLGIPGIDEQHSKFFLMIDTLLKRLKKEPFSPDVVSGSFQEIIEHLRLHFSTEETLLEIIGFPAMEEHRAEHAKFLDQFIKEEAPLQSGDSGKTICFISDFRDAMMSHIVSMDTAYTSHIEKLLTLGKKFKISTLRAQSLTK